MGLLWGKDKKDIYYPEQEEKSNKLYHIGTPHQGNIPHSGRYEYGSGENARQHTTDPRELALKYREERNPDGTRKYTETDIAKALGLSTTEYRRIMSVSKGKERSDNIARATRLREKGMSIEAIAAEMDAPVSTVKSWLVPHADKNEKAKENIKNLLKEQVEEKTYLDIGKGVGAQLGISETSLRNAVFALEKEGYAIREIKVPQATNIRQRTTVDVLVKEDVPWNEVWENRDLIRSPMGVWTEDNGRTFKDIQDPVSINSNRIFVKYGDEGGRAKDGLIEIRPGVNDISLGNNNYAQVRIAVDGTHYMKGMAIYSDHIPAGYDIVFNTNKDSGTPKCGEKNNTVLKPLKDDPDNPFGSTIRQFNYIGKDGQEHQSPINLVNTDEDWDKWSRTLASQFLSKQPVALAKQQLNLVYQDKKDQFEEIMKYPNNTIKAKLLKDLADECDSAAVDLKAAALPRQETKVILPLEKIKDNEVYAPTYNTGEEVVLIRYPHAGQFEIPRLIVNNNNKEGKEVLGNAKKAIGINSKVAEQLSGADFDGDTVVVIPTAGQNIKNMKPLQALADFDDKREYKRYDGMPTVGKPLAEGGDGFDTQKHMGKVSNLITDMTIKGAPMEDIAYAVRHSMVVIDAEKHQLDWKRSEIENRIKELKKKYQGGANRGASTIISKAGSESEDFPARDPRYNIDPDTGKRIWRTAKDAYYLDKQTGELKYRHERSTKMDETDDAFTLVSRGPSGEVLPMEAVYATHANKMKALGNEIRKAILATPSERMNQSAREQYAEEVQSLEDKMRVALMNAPNERLAQAVASKRIAAILRDNPGMNEDDEMKMRNQIINGTRSKAGASKHKDRVIHVTDKEWSAIVAGALAKDKVLKILGFMDSKEVLERTFPRETKTLSPVKLSRARSLLSAGYTWTEVADTLGISEATLRRQVNGV